MDTKTMRIFKGFSAAVLLLTLAAAAFGQQAKPAELEAVKTFDLGKYAGTWYEIAAFPNKFQKSCVGNITVKYVLKGEGAFDAVNQCVEKDGRTKEAKGSGKLTDTTGGAKMKIRFAPGIFSFLSTVWENYWLIDLGPEYDYAVIGEPKRRYLWVLSRDPEMSDALYQQILRRVEEKGYNPAMLVKTPQNMETIRGGTVGKQ